MLERIEQLEANIASLKVFAKDHSLEAIRKNRFDEWALRYGLLESIQILIDLSCHLVSRFNLGSVKTYADCIENLREHSYISDSLSERLVSMIGLRNLLVHEYSKIDLEKLYGYLEFTRDFSEFIRQIEKVLES